MAEQNLNYFYIHAPIRKPGSECVTAAVRRHRPLRRMTITRITLSARIQPLEARKLSLAVQSAKGILDDVPAIPGDEGSTRL